MLYDIDDLAGREAGQAQLGQAGVLGTDCGAGAAGSCRRGWRGMGGWAGFKVMRGWEGAGRQ